MKTASLPFRSGMSLAVACAWTFLAAQGAGAATFKVTNDSDDGAGSLREAIKKANAFKDSDTIAIEIPAGKERSILLRSPLPNLSSNISIINTRETLSIARSAIPLRGEGDFGIFAIMPGNVVYLEGLTITKGTYGGVSNHGSRLTMRNCVVHQNEGNAGVTNTGAANAPAELVMRNCTLSENRIVREFSSIFFFVAGSGLFNTAAEGTSASATLIDCVIRANRSERAQIVGVAGGAVANYSDGGQATTSLTGCLVEANYTDTGAGGVYNAAHTQTGGASLSLLNCTVRDHHSSQGLQNQPPNADGIANTVATLEACTFSGNTSSGAISNRGMLSLTNCTFSQNSVSGPTGSGGAGIQNTSGTTSVTNCTFSANELGGEARGQSVLNKAGATFITANSLYHAVSPGVNFVNAGTFTSRGHNLCNDNAGGPLSTAPGGLLNATGDQRITEPRINALAENGGATETCGLKIDSPAINAGDDALAPATDQRGRFRSGVSDIGAFEFSSTTPVSLKPSRLGNIATRLPVATGDNVLIAGFIVTGTEPKKVMVRALGPSLPFANSLANPTLELIDGSGELIESNDNWIDSANKQAIIDSTIPPSNDLESAIVVHLAADGAAYTAVVRGVNEGTGIGVVEVYDLDAAANSKLANISTRGLVQTGDDVLIGGTIVTGTASQKVIVRALGPSLPVEGKLEDPALELIDGNGALLAANDNWRTGGHEAAITETGVAPSNDFESALIYQLPSNNAAYTVVVRGAGETTGVGVVEVYTLNQFQLQP